MSFNLFYFVFRSRHVLCRSFVFVLFCYACCHSCALAEDNSELFAEETAEQLEMSRQEQWEYRASVPGLLKPDELGDFDDSDL